jgi:hypothetical protein
MRSYLSVVIPNEVRDLSEKFLARRGGFGIAAL